MTILLDTHPFLWWLNNDPKLSITARAAIESPGQGVLLSVASAWEITIKAGLGKLNLPEPAAAFLESRLERHSITLQPIELRHLARLSILPPLHRDPFDRLLLAQSMEDDIPLVTADREFSRYGATLIW